MPISPPEPRYAIDVPAQIIISDESPQDARVSNVSRHGCRVIMPALLPAGQEIRIEIAGFPRLQAKVVWSDGERTGCLFLAALSAAMFSMMVSRANGVERRAT